MIALLLTTLHSHFRQRQAEAAEAQARVDAAEALAAQTARYNAELRRIAERDGLSSTVDRARFLVCLGEAFERKACIQRSFAVMYVDIDHFERMNETLGQAAGDELLVHAATRIQRRVRRRDVVGALGGHKFAVLVKDLHNERVAEVARRLLDGLAQPYAVGVTVQSSASIGITLSDYGYQAPTDMLRDAEAAMSRAKSLGGARYVLHHPDVLQRTAVPERNELLGV
jgi:diguanylate cyclase (GGDEF)-like protein